MLRENGLYATRGVLFFRETHQRVRIAIDADLIQLTEIVTVGARQLRQSDVAPPPLVDSPKCLRCSLVGICLPDETSFCRHSAAGDSLAQLILFDIGPIRQRSVSSDEEFPANRVRQMVTARHERKPLYLNSQGSRLANPWSYCKPRTKANWFKSSVSMMSRK